MIDKKAFPLPRAIRIATRLFVVLYIALSASSGQTRQQSPSTAVQPDPENAYRYDISIEVEEADLANRMRSRSRLIAERGNPVASLGRLRGRVETDLATFRSILRAEGYYDARLQTLTERDGRTVDVRIIVAAGPRYQIDEVALRVMDGDMPSDLVQELLQRAGLKNAMPARTQAVLDAETAIMRALPELGFPFARRERRDVVVDHQDRTVDVNFIVTAGPRVIVTGLEFRGAEDVDRKFLGRIAAWKNGEFFDQGKIEGLRRRLIATGLFRSLRTRLDRQTDLIDAPMGDAAERSDLIIELITADMRTISIGAGYSTTEGVGTEASWEHRNFFGSGERLRATATVAQIEQGIRLDFLKPYFRRPDQALTGDAEFRRDDTDAFDDITAEASVGLDRRLSEQWTVGAAVTAQYSRIQEDGVRRNFLLAGLPLVANWNGIDDLLDPKTGGRMRLNVEPYQAWQSGGFFFVRSEIEGSAYWGIDARDRYVVAARAALGSITGASRDRLPANKRFYAGGGGSVRGFGFQEVGPKDSDGDPIGGRSLVEMSLEFRAKITNSIGLVPFVEGGNVYEDRIPEFNGLRWGAGLGFRYYTSFAPIRVDLATPINRRPGDDRIQFYISIGQSF